jgi:SAM-dependent methyltransferase
MKSHTAWSQQARCFFDERAEGIRHQVTPETLCYVSGREQRLWTDPEMIEDLLASIKDQLAISQETTLLEMGCAAGFLARGLAPLVAHYTGVDIAPKAVDVARGLGLPNATFHVADGTSLPWSDGVFDRVLCYDVFTNFPSFAAVAPVIKDMVRVTRPGGKLLVGSLADEARKEAFEKRVTQVVQDLDQSHGPIKAIQETVSFLSRVRRWFTRNLRRLSPEIICYYFRKEDFRQLGSQLGVQTQIHDIHARNPYHGYRFNVVYTRTSAR